MRILRRGHNCWAVALFAVLLLPNVAATADAAKEACEKGKALVEKGDFDAAIAELTESIRLDPKDANAYCGRGFAYGSRGELDKAIADLTEAIRLNPKLAIAYYNRGRAYEGNGDLDKAVADLDASVELNPQSSAYYEKRGAVRVRRGDYDGGLADFHAAIRIDPNDAAAKFETSPKPPLPAAAIHRGEEQLRQMLRDRPEMAQFGKKAGALHQWATRKFAGEDLCQGILWDASEPVCFDADSRTLTAESPGQIRIRRTYSHGLNKGEEQSFEALWRDAVFELNNVANAREFRRLELQVAARQLTKKAFVAKMIAGESRAVEKTRAFYIHVFLPWASEQHAPTNPDLWFVGWRSDPRDTFLAHIDEQGTYWKNYEHQYDSILLCSSLKNGENEKAIELAAEMKKQALASEEIAEIFSERGMANRSNGEPDKDIADLRAALWLNGKLAAAHSGRADSYRQKREYDKAIADYTEAIRLDPTLAGAYSGRADAYEKKGQKAKAEEDLVQAKKLGCETE